ncbi:restriction endonuclease Mrr [Bradyrhizobium barranii subsp. barranii]|uniref:hypothetical protein n=1 Tax=Bradyrhizobium liaoningense TaxID=43992 RepID=UPI001BA60B51|nr:hypothetical protein [Bradyrhizobium liaoningense]MBR0879088.1 hypothetical protein [Bradyrhizobium liaoningense]
MMDETTKTMFRNMQEQSLVDGAARIIDQYAFRSAFGAAMQTRQRIARNKARMILADANGARETLLDELVSAHKQIDELIALIKETGQLEITSSELWSGIGRRAALLARHGRLVS